MVIGFNGSTGATVRKGLTIVQWVTADNSLLETGTETLISTVAGAAVAVAPVKLSPSRLVIAYGDNTGSEQLRVRTNDVNTNITGAIGVAFSSSALSASGLAVVSGPNTSVSGLTTSNEYYADIDGAFTTAALGGTKKMGTAMSATRLVVNVN